MARQLALILVVATAGLAALTGATRAGGWASVTLDTPLGEPRAGESIRLGFMVKQHGETPVHAAFGQPVTVYLTARHKQSGERIRADAVKSAAVGHFTVDVTFPKAGVWYAQITPEPFEGTTLDPVTVLGAPAARTDSTVSRAGSVSGWVAAAIAVAALGLAALVGLLIARHRGAQGRLVERPR